MTVLDDILTKVAGLTKAERAEVEKLAAIATKGMKWIPNPGPQTDCYLSDADVTLYGGEPGGGKSDCGLGLAFTAHKRPLVMRRRYTDLSGLTDRAIEINGSRAGFNGSAPPKLRTDDGRLIEFGAAQHVGDEESWQGRAHDFLYIDEAAQFAKIQVRKLMGWVRSSDPKQRCRTVLGTNPPLSDEGDWLVEMFAPWLDANYPNPAEPGELRWFIADDDDNDIEVTGAGSYDVNGRQVQAISRTYIPSGVQDNPFYANSDYQKQLDNLPAHLRKILMGGFQVGRADHDRQLIPTEWINESISKWTESPPAGIPQCSIGVDIAQGGTDTTVLAKRYDGWFAPLIEVPGKDTPEGREVAALVFKYRRDESHIVLDMGGGYGGSAYEHLRDNGVTCVKYKGAEGSTARTKNGSLGFYNTRAQAYYRLYEGLDPGQPGGQRIILPDDRVLKAELCSIRLDDSELNVIKLEPKKKLCERTGKSPNKADAIAMAWFGGGRIDTRYNTGERGKSRPRVISTNRRVRMR